MINTVLALVCAVLAPVAPEPVQLVKDSPRVSWAEGPAYKTFANEFRKSFLDSFKEKTNKTPNKRCLDEATEAAWDAVFRHHFGNLKVTDAQELLNSESDIRWLKLVSFDDELMKKFSDVFKKMGKKIVEEPSKYLE